MQSATLITAANAAIIKAVVDAEFQLINDHTSNRDLRIEIGGVAIYTRGEEQHVVALFTGSQIGFYGVDKIVIDKKGEPHLTRSAVGGVISDATDDIVADVEREWANFDWNLIEQRPILHPGNITDITVNPYLIA